MTSDVRPRVPFCVDDRILPGGIGRVPLTIATPGDPQVSETGDTGTAMPANPRPSWPYLVVGALSYPVLRIVFRVPRGARAASRGRLRARGQPSLEPRSVPLRCRSSRGGIFASWRRPSSSGSARSADHRLRRLPVRRGQARSEAVETAIEPCREGHIVVMFPEGTRARRVRGEARGRWRGRGRIALEGGVPLVPAGAARRAARLGCASPTGTR